MEALTTYLIKSSVWLTGFALVYMLFLRNERFFTLNRIYLVSGILVSIIFPLFTWHYMVLLPVVPFVEVSNPQVQGIVVTEESFTTQDLLLFAYLSGILFLVFRILRQTLPVFRIIKKSETHSYHSVQLIRTDAYPASFSFFSFVFVNPSISDTETKEIVNHELEHIRQKHWIDLLLFEILRMMLWFNPVSWLYGHLIRQNHEYLADERALQRTSNPAIYRAALLNQLFDGPVISLANSFNYSLNKKRFTMMKQTISSPIRKFKLLLVLPLIVGVFYAFAAPEYKFIGGSENQSPQKSLYTISKDKIDIPFTTQLQKSDLDAVKADLDKLGMKIDYTTLDFTETGNLKQISAIVKSSDGGSVSFASGELTTTNYPTFKTYSDGSFGVYFQKAVTGKVVSEDGKPLKGASVVVSGKTIGTVTDASGNFKLILTDASPIVISYVGFGSQKVTPDFEKEMIIKMKTVIVGIDMGNTTTSSDHSNSGVQIRNAGVSGIEDKPLIVVDGLVTTFQMENVDPETIQSVKILKVEAAKKKYGEKVKNGAVEIISKPNQKLFVPEFPGGISALIEFISANLKYPEKAKEEGIQGMVYVHFIVSKTGKIENIKISESVDPSLDAEALRIISLLPDWKPATKAGKNVDVPFSFPVNFQLPTNQDKSTHTFVEQMPEFPGGTEALNAFITDNLKYPLIALENGIQGLVFVSFVVGKTGEVKNVKISRGVDPSLDKEAMRIVKAMPNWNPGKQNGEYVEVAYEMPINFTLPADYHPISNEKLHTKTDYKIGNVIWVNNAVYSSAKLNKVLGINTGDQYSKEKVTERIQGEIASLYLDNGYLFYNVQITEIPKSDGTTDLKFTLYEGNRWKIGMVEIKGNKNVSTKEILNKITIKPGDLFSRTKLTQSVRALATIDKLDPEKINPDVNPVIAKTTFEFNIVNIVFNVTEK